MKNLKIKSKISAIMAILLVLVSVASGLQIFQMSEINNQSTLIAHSWLPSVEDSGIMNNIIGDFRVAEYAQIASQSDAERVKYDKARADLQADMEKEMKTYKDAVQGGQEKILFETFEKNWNNYFNLSQKVDQLYESGQKDAAAALLNGESEKQYDTTSASIDALVKYNSDGAKVESNEADSMYAQNKIIAFALTIVIIFIGLIAGFLLVKNVATPIKGITDYMGVLASGDLSKNVPDRERKDEIGNMAMAIQTFKDNMVRGKELEAEQRKEELAKQERQKKVEAAIKKFELSMSDIVKFVASASAELQASAQSLSASAEETSKQSGAVAAASQQAAANVQTVASATEELSSSINEIASQVARSSQVASQAVEDAQLAGKSVMELVEAAQKIGDVTQIISAIAGQTNLLALNATIEAARAGDAGKGFAVVASEVKNLANESTKATEEISGQIAHIQQISQTSAEAIETICRIIREMDEISGTISAAIQEQTSATQEISRNVSEAYTGTSEVTQNIGSVSDAANSTGSASHQVLSAADELSRQSEILKEEFDIFVRDLAAA